MIEDISNRLMRDFATCLSSRLADGPTAPSGEEVASGEAPPEAVAAARRRRQEGADRSSASATTAGRAPARTAAATGSAAGGEAGGRDRAVLLRAVGAGQAPLRAVDRSSLTAVVLAREAPASRTRRGSPAGGRTISGMMQETTSIPAMM